MEVVIERDRVLGLGISIKGGKEHCLPVIISDVFEGSSASRNSALLIGSEILAVNGESLENASHPDAVRALKNAGQIVKLTIRRNTLIRQAIARASMVIQEDDVPSEGFVEHDGAVGNNSATTTINSSNNSSRPPSRGMGVPRVTSPTPEIQSTTPLRWQEQQQGSAPVQHPLSPHSPPVTPNTPHPQAFFQAQQHQASSRPASSALAQRDALFTSQPHIEVDVIPLLPPSALLKAHPSSRTGSTPQAQPPSSSSSSSSSSSTTLLQHVNPNKHLSSSAVTAPSSSSPSSSISTNSSTPKMSSQGLVERAAASPFPPASRPYRPFSPPLSPHPQPQPPQQKQEKPPQNLTSALAAQTHFSASKNVDDAPSHTIHRTSSISGHGRKLPRPPVQSGSSTPSNSGAPSSITSTSTITNTITTTAPGASSTPSNIAPAASPPTPTSLPPPSSSPAVLSPKARPRSFIGMLFSGGKSSSSASSSQPALATSTSAQNSSASPSTSAHKASKQVTAAGASASTSEKDHRPPQDAERDKHMEEEALIAHRDHRGVTWLSSPPPPPPPPSHQEDQGARLQQQHDTDDRHQHQHQHQHQKTLLSSQQQLPHDKQSSGESPALKRLSFGTDAMGDLGAGYMSSSARFNPPLHSSPLVLAASSSLGTRGRPLPLPQTTLGADGDLLDQEEWRRGMDLRRRRDVDLRVNKPPVPVDAEVPLGDRMLSAEAVTSLGGSWKKASVPNATVAGHHRGSQQARIAASAGAILSEEFPDLYPEAAIKNNKRGDPVKSVVEPEIMPAPDKFESASSHSGSNDSLFSSLLSITLDPFLATMGMRETRTVRVHNETGEYGAAGGRKGAGAGSDEPTKEPLPDGWVERIDSRTNRKYFANLMTKQTTWVDPRGHASVAIPDSLDMVDWSALPFGWEASTDAQGDAFFINHMEKRTSWDPPYITLEREQLVILEEVLRKHELEHQRQEGVLHTFRTDLRERQDKLDKLREKRKSLATVVVAMHTMDENVEVGRVEGQLEVVVETIASETEKTMELQHRVDELGAKLSRQQQRLKAVSQLNKSLRQAIKERMRDKREQTARKLEGQLSKLQSKFSSLVMSATSLEKRRKDLFGKVPGRKEYEALEVPKMPDYKTFFLTADAVLKSDCELHIDCLLVEMEFVHVLTEKKRTIDHLLNKVEACLINTEMSGDGARNSMGQDITQLLDDEFSNEKMAQLFEDITRMVIFPDTFFAKMELLCKVA